MSSKRSVPPRASKGRTRPPPRRVSANSAPGRVFDLCGPSDYRFADALDRSAWLVTEPKCAACGQKTYADAHPLVLEWTPGSDEIGDFVWTHRGRVVVRRHVGEALAGRFPSLTLAPIEMVQEKQLRRPSNPARGKRRVWLPYEGEELVELVVGARIAPHPRTTLTTNKACGSCGRALGTLVGAETRGVKFNRRLGRLLSVRQRKRQPGRGLLVDASAVQRTPLFRSRFGSVLCSEAAMAFIQAQGFTNVGFCELGETVD